MYANDITVTLRPTQAQRIADDAKVAFNREMKEGRVFDALRSARLIEAVTPAGGEGERWSQVVVGLEAMMLVLPEHFHAT